MVMKISSSSEILHLLLLASAGFTKSEKDQKNGDRSITEALVMYVDYFEKSFLQETEQFYKVEAQNYFTENSVNAYMKKVSSRSV